MLMKLGRKIKHQQFLLQFPLKLISDLICSGHTQNKGSIAIFFALLCYYYKDSVAKHSLQYQLLTVNNRNVLETFTFLFSHLHAGSV